MSYLVTTAREGRWSLVATLRDDEPMPRPAVRDFVTELGRDGRRRQLEGLSDEFAVLAWEAPCYGLALVRQTGPAQEDSECCS